MRRDHPEVHSAIYSNQLDNSGRGKIGRPLTILGSSNDPRYSSEAEHRCAADRGEGGGEEGKDAAQDTHHSLPRGISPWRGIKRGSRGIGSQRQTARVTSRCRSIGVRPSKRNGTCVT